MAVNPALLRELDNTTRVAYTAARDYWAAWIECSTALVVIGCAVEVPEVLHEVWPKFLSKHQVSAVKIIATLGLLVVILGVGGELVFGQLMSRVDGQLQTFNAVLLTDAQLKAALAEKESAQAQEETQKLKDLAAGQMALVAAANLSAGKANERAASLELQAERLKKELLLRQNRPSVFESRTTLNRLTKSMGRFAGQRIEVEYAEGLWGTARAADQETYLLAHDLHSYLHIAKWNVGGFPFPTPYNGFSLGIYIYVSRKSSQKTMDAATALARVFRAVPLDVVGKPDVWIDELPKRFPGPGIFAEINKVLPPRDDETIVLAVCPHP